MEIERMIFICQPRTLVEGSAHPAPLREAASPMAVPPYRLITSGLCQGAGRASRAEYTASMGQPSATNNE